MALRLDHASEATPETATAWGASVRRLKRLARSRELGAHADEGSTAAPWQDHALAQFALAEALLRSDDPDVVFFIRCMYYAAAGLFSPADGHGQPPPAVFDAEATMDALRRQPHRLRVWQACFDAFEATCMLGPVMAQAGILGDRVHGPQLMERIHQEHSARALALHAALKGDPDPLESDGPALAIGLGYVAARRIAEAGPPLQACRPPHHGDLQAILDADPALAAKVSEIEAKPLMKCLFRDAVVHWLHVEQLNAVATEPPK